MKNKYLKLFLLFISIFCFTLNVKAVTPSGEAENVKIYKVTDSSGNQKQQFIGTFKTYNPDIKDNIQYAKSIGLFNIYNPNTKKTDVAYCLQMGKKGPTGQNYKLVESIDIAQCKKIADPNIHYGACGLAEIFYKIQL